MATLQADVVSQDFVLLGNLFLLQSILLNMGTNLTLISQGQQGQTITVSNANLFQLAAKYYGDPNQWVVIAKANGLTDPYANGGSVISVAVTNGGSGYTMPTGVFSGNEINAASVTFRLFSGSITSVTVQNGGLFLNHPTLSVVDSSGSGAEFIVNCAQTLIIPQSANSLTGGVLVD